EGRFAIILPEAAVADAERLHRRVQFALGGRVDSGPDRVRLYAVLVELRTEEDANVFREHAEAALERAKQAAADRLSAAQQLDRRLAPPEPKLLQNRRGVAQ